MFLANVQIVSVAFTVLQQRHCSLLTRYLNMFAPHPSQTSQAKNLHRLRCASARQNQTLLFSIRLSFAITLVNTQSGAIVSKSKCDSHCGCDTGKLGSTISWGTTTCSAPRKTVNIPFMGNSISAGSVSTVSPLSIFSNCINLRQPKDAERTCPEVPEETNGPAGRQRPLVGGIH